MKKTARFINLKTLPIFIATLFIVPATFAQEPANQVQNEPFGILKGMIVDDQSREPMANIQVRLIGFQVEALTNARGEFFLEAPARNYAGLVMEIPDLGDMRLFEEAITLTPGQLLDIDRVAMKATTMTEPFKPENPATTDAPQTPQPQTTPAKPQMTQPNQLNPTPPNPALVNNDIGVAAQVQDTVNVIAPNGPAIPPAVIGAPAEPGPPVDIHPVLLRARTMAANGNFFGAELAYEEYLGLFPLDGPIAVEYGVMVYHNIQNAEGRTILKQASKLPGLRPIDIDALNRYLIRPVVVVHDGGHHKPHVHVRLRHRKRSCH